MRKCPLCHEVMNEENYLSDQGLRLSDVLLIVRHEDYTKTSHPLKAAVCPKCGHEEFYIDIEKKEVV